MKRILAVVLSTILLLGTVVSPVYAADLISDPQEEVISGETIPENAAEEADPAEIAEDEQESETADENEPTEEAVTEIKIPSQTFTQGGSDQNDALLYGYLNQELAKKGFQVPESEAEEGVLAEETADQYLTGNNLIVYNYLKEKIAETAKYGGSTEYEIPVSLFGFELDKWYYASDLGLEEGDSLYDQLSGLISFDYSAVITALLYDCPYEMYWYHKTSGTSVSGYGFSTGSNAVKIDNNMVLAMNVCPDCSSSGMVGSTKLLEEKAEAVQRTIAGIPAIVEQYESLSDYDKLDSYRQKICDLTSYNDEAAGWSTARYGSPWQLIYVFDGDPDTTVVCEGYSKAFQYLCDLSAFNSGLVRCICVTGEMQTEGTSGGHMWNIVRMDDGKNYLADITNCDTGTIGADRQLFLAAVEGDNAITAGGYSFTLENSWADYYYDEDTLGAFSENDLILANTGAYDPDAPEELADYSAIDELIPIYEELTYHESEYTPESWAALQAAMDNIIYFYEKSRQAEVDAMAQAIRDAMDGLVKIEEPDPDPNPFEGAKDLELNVTAEAVIEEGEVYCYFRFIPQESGQYMFMSMSEDDTYCTLLDADGTELTNDDESGEYHNFTISYNFTAGQTYYFKVKFYYNGTGTFPVILKAAPKVVAVSAEALTLSEADGRTITESVIDPATGEGMEATWIYYSDYAEKLQSINVEMEDGTVFSGDFNTVRNQFTEEYGYSPNYSVSDSQSWDHAWTVGGSYRASLIFEGVTAEFDVTIEKNPILEVAIEDITIFDTNGFWDYGYTDEGEEEYWFHYNLNSRSIRKLTVITTEGEFSGTTDQVGQAISDRFGTWPDFSIEDPQNSRNQWDIGDYTIAVEYGGIRTNAVVHIIENPVVSISAEKVVLFDDIQGEMRNGYVEDEDGSGHYEEYRYYDEFYAKKITVTANNGKTYNGTPSKVQKEFEEDYGVSISVTFYDTQSPKNPWKIGINTAIIWFADKDAEYEVEVKSSIVKSITVEDMTLREDQARRNNLGIWYNVEPGALTVETEEKAFSGEYYKVINEIEEYYNIGYLKCSIEDDQHEKVWEPGTHTVKLIIGSYEKEFTVEILPSILVSVSPETARFMEGDTTTRGFLDEEGHYVQWRPYNLYERDVPGITVLTTDGKTLKGSPDDVAEQIQNEYGFYPNIDVIDNQSPENVWGLGSHEATMYYGKMTVPFTVEIIENPIASVTVKDFTISEDEGSKQTSSHWDDEKQEWVVTESIHYDSMPKSVTVTLKSGEVLSGNPRDLARDLSNRYQCRFRCWTKDDQYYGDSFETGNTYPVTLYFGPVEKTYNVTITERQIRSITVEDMEIWQSDVHWRAIWDGNKIDRYPVYDIVPDNITIVTSEGEITGNAEEVEDALREMYGVQFHWYVEEEENDRQTREKPWDPGKHHVTLYVGNLQAEFNVTIKEGPVLEITELGDTEIYEGNKKEKTEWVHNLVTDDYEEVTYEYYDAEPSSITIRTIDGEEISGQLWEINNKLSARFGSWFNFGMISDQSHVVEWGAGEHTAVFCIGQCKKDYKVTVKKSPIKSVSVPDYYLFDSDYDMRTVWYYDQSHTLIKVEHYKAYPIYSNIITVETENKTYTGDPWDVKDQIENDLGISISFEFYESSDDVQDVNQEWGTGVHTAKLQFGGQIATFHIEIKESPIVSITVPDQIRFESERHTSWDTDPDTGDEVEYPAYSVMPENMTVVYKKEDGTQATVTGDENAVKEAVLGNAYDTIINSGLLLRFHTASDQSASNIWQIGTHKASVSCGDASAEYNVEILGDPIKSVEIPEVTIYTSDAVKKEVKTVDEQGNPIVVEIDYYEEEVIEPKSFTVTWSDGTTTTGSSTVVLAKMTEKFGRTGYYECWGSKQFFTRPWEVGEHIGVMEIGGHSYEYTIHLVESSGTVPVTGITLKNADGSISGANISLEMPAASSQTLTAVIAPANAGNKKVTWKSDNTGVAKIDENGKITAVKIGKAKITATTDDGKKTASCTVTVLFKDVLDKSKANYKAIYSLVDKGVIAGFGGTEFRPDDQCTRAQVVLFLWRAANKPKPKSTKLSFADAAEIKKLAPDYTSAIAWGNEQGIVMGFTSGANKGKFMPNDPCTRAQIVLFLYRYAKQPKVKTTTLNFKDAAAIKKMAPAYTNAILWAVEKKITTGYKLSSGGYEFRPAQTCTRGECATFIYRMLG